MLGEQKKQVFLVLIILFIALIFLSFVPYLKSTFSNIFDSQQFKAIRLVITIFGIIGIILSFLNWYISKNPKSIIKKTNFQIDISTPLSGTNEINSLNSALNNIIWDPFVMCFTQGWKPVLTKTDNNYNVIAKSFTENRGELISKDKIDAELAPSRSTVNIAEFYIPPKASFNITREEIEGRLWAYITIKNKHIDLKLKITTLDKIICYVKIFYLKKGFLNYIFYDYNEYDEWFEIINKKISLKQKINVKINEYKRKQKNKPLTTQ